ncbi:MAG: hypothetical protein HY054_11345 [Proteobacteria bacterium]|nr:hypothetical protein [Pseudomonadota bacterium]
MTADEIDKLNRDQVLDLMGRLGLTVEHSMFATIHHRSPERPDGWSEQELDEVAEDLADADLLEWRRRLSEHFARMG